MSLADALIALAIAVGVVGVVVPLMPGSALVGAAVLLWAVLTGTAAGWLVAAGCIVLLLAGTATKYVVPERRLREAGVPRRSLVLGGVLGVVGFFVVPVLGLVLGFLAGVFLAEWSRGGGHAGAAWRSTLLAVRAVGLAVVLELTFALLSAACWGIGVLLT